jgi:hypothetical protein
MQRWAGSLFDQIDIAEMEEKCQRFGKLTFKLERGLPRNKVGRCRLTQSNPR